MTKSARNLLEDLLQELRDVAEFTERGESAFMSVLRTQKAVIRSCEVVGELSKRLPQSTRSANPQID